MHVNSKVCPGCNAKLAVGGVHQSLQDFFDSFRAANPDAHVSQASRTSEEQNEDFAKGVSKAKAGQSPHDYTVSLALDWFRLTQAGGASFDSTWFKNVLAPAARQTGLTWGGDFHSIHDLPHVEVKDWQDLVKSGAVKPMK